MRDLYDRIGPGDACSTAQSHVVSVIARRLLADKAILVYVEELISQEYAGIALSLANGACFSQ
jgi:hypothetical protein